MDDFPLDRPELNGSLITLEFGQGGRIQQLWVADPSLPDEGQEYQFVLPPVTFGEEFAEDYFPGTILIGARTRPDDPWILDRNKNANPIEDEDELRVAAFEYEFPLLAELRVTGKFYEQTQPFPQIMWDLKIVNEGRVSVEIGELAFPLALNNLFEGEPGVEDRKPNLLSDRVRIHPFVGGSASYLFAQRSNGEPPGLLVYPGEGTSWELWASVPASLNTQFRWGGIPVVYVFSRASIEREGWGDGVNPSSSLVLEPGDSKTIQTRFAATGADGHDAALQTLAICGRPAMKLLPAAVAPKDVGIAVETGGTTPSRYTVSHKADIETDSDEQGGFCFVRPKQSGPLRLSYDDPQGRWSHVQLFLTEPIETLIRERARFIADHQRKDSPGTSLHHALLPMNLRTGNLIDGAEALGGPFAVESGLADALFLAEKNAIYPEPREIEVLSSYVQEFVKGSLQSPADYAVGCAFVDPRSVAIHYGRAQTYALLFCLYHSLARVARACPDCVLDGEANLRDAYLTARAMFRNALGIGRPIGVMGLSHVDDLVQDLRLAGMGDEASELEALAERRAREVVKTASRPVPDWSWNPAAYEEIVWAANKADEPDLAERAFRQATTFRGLAPCWWSYGTDIWVPNEPDASVHPAFADRGMMLLGHTTVQNSMLFFRMCGRDYDRISDGHMRLAFGGMMAPWAMVRPDGAASMGFCPDPASKQTGASVWTGDLGLALFEYLRGVASWVFPSRALGLFTFGCHFETDENAYTVRPWDGVGRRVVMRQIGFEARTSFGKILSLRLDVRKRWIEVEIENPAPYDAKALLIVKGLWGQKLEVEGKSVQAVDGEWSAPITLPASGRTRIEAKAVIS